MEYVFTDCNDELELEIDDDITTIDGDRDEDVFSDSN
jgi:hypothetical protein